MFKKLFNLKNKIFSWSLIVFSNYLTPLCFTSNSLFQTVIPKKFFWSLFHGWSENENFQKWLKSERQVEKKYQFNG